MKFRDALKIVKQQCVGEQRGSVSLGQIVYWEDTKVKFTFVPEHAYTTDGRLIKTDLLTGKKKEV